MRHGKDAGARFAPVGENEPPMRVKMCSVHVEDPAAAFRFYTETLGFLELLSMPAKPEFIERLRTMTEADSSTLRIGMP